MATKTVLEAALTAGSNLRNAMASVRRVLDGALTFQDMVDIEQVLTNGVTTALRVTFTDVMPDAEIKACLKGIANLVNRPSSGISSGITFTLSYDTVASGTQRQYSV